MKLTGIGNVDADENIYQYTLVGESVSISTEYSDIYIEPTESSDFLYCESVSKYGKDYYFLEKHSAAQSSGKLFSGDTTQSFYSDTLADKGFKEVRVQSDGDELKMYLIGDDGGQAVLNGGASYKHAGFYNYEVYNSSSQPEGIQLLEGDDGAIYAYIIYSAGSDGTRNIIQEKW